MIEVFKTNVEYPHEALMLVDQIHKRFGSYKANFDLEDCDKILRIKCVDSNLKAGQIINLLADLGFQAEILPDEPPVDILLNRLAVSIKYSGY